MLRLAYRNLFQSKARLAMSVGGVALALMLILALDAIMTGAERQLTAYIDNSEADVWVAQSGVRNLHMVSSWVPSSVTSEVEDVSGVESVTPIMYLTGPVDAGQDQSLAYVIGLPEDAEMGKPWNLEEGEPIPEPGEAIIDSEVAERSGLKLGDEVKILGQELEVAGLSGGTATLTNSVAFISMEDFEQVRGTGQVVSFVLAEVEADDSPEAVARRVEEDVGSVSAQTRASFAEQERRLVKDMAADLLAIMNLAGFMTGLAVVALTVYTATLARRSEYGVLKALGARNARLYGVVLAQALYSVALGFVVGLVFTLLLTVVVPGLTPNLTLQVSGASLLKVGAVSLVIAGLAAVLPIRQIAGLHPATVFRGK
jgi:putative ABC transport system permease protein